MENKLVWTKKNEMINNEIDKDKFNQHFPTIGQKVVVREKELLVTPDVIYYKENEQTKNPLQEKAMRYVCKLFLNNGICKRRGCKFAHNDEELHAPCRMDKKCKRPNCQFFHTDDTFEDYLIRLRTQPPTPPSS